MALAFGGGRKVGTWCYCGGFGGKEPKSGAFGENKTLWACSLRVAGFAVALKGNVADFSAPRHVRGSFG